MNVPSPAASSQPMSVTEKQEPVDVRRRRLKFRSWHRGTREMDLTRADELMVTCNVFDHAARLRSYEILAAVRDRMPMAA